MTCSLETMDKIRLAAFNSGGPKLEAEVTNLIIELCELTREEALLRRFMSCVGMLRSQYDEDGFYTYADDDCLRRLENLRIDLLSFREEPGSLLHRCLVRITLMTCYDGKTPNEVGRHIGAEQLGLLRSEIFKLLWEEL